MPFDASAALYRAAAKDLDPFSTEQLETVLIAHGWTLQEQDYTVRRLWVSPDGTSHRLNLSPVGDDWRWNDLGDMLGRFASYHDLSLVEALRRFGAV